MFILFKKHRKLLKSFQKDCQKMPSNALNLRHYIVYVFEFLFWLVKPSFWQVFGDFVRIRLPVEHLTNCFDMFFYRHHYNQVTIIANITT